MTERFWARVLAVTSRRSVAPSSAGRSVWSKRGISGALVSTVVAFGNGNNDRKMLRTARIGIAVTEGEGAAVDILMPGDLNIASINSARDLLLNPKRLKATLRY